ncbi:hypothetical protein GCM10010912_28720 [Paenibacillus albidus]|uniref:Uncharacterized protein n=1 Tax=Paenibacillus albidus TaxID=2041023 RepID=A0A917CBN2_9BACL|nr:hypothetical protein GCM10010912_28720 [Paenibacillus albidus]
MKGIPAKERELEEQRFYDSMLLKHPLFTMGPNLKEDIDNGSDNVL